MAMAQGATTNNSYRWLQLLAGIICMVMVANLQYGWTYFVDPMNDGARLGSRRHPVSPSPSSSPPRPGWCRSKAGSSIASARASWSPSAASWSRSPGRSTRSPTTLADALSRRGPCPASAPVPSTAPASATRSNGFRTGAGSPPASPPPGSAPAPRRRSLPIINVIPTYGYQSAFLWFGLGQGLIVPRCCPGV